MGGAEGYTSTAEGKIVSASFLDNWNKIVLTIRDNPSLIQASAAQPAKPMPRAAWKAAARQRRRCVLGLKIAGVKAKTLPRARWWPP